MRNGTLGHRTRNRDRFLARISEPSENPITGEKQRVALKPEQNRLGLKTARKWLRRWRPVAKSAGQGLVEASARRWW